MTTRRQRGTLLWWLALSLAVLAWLMWVARPGTATSRAQAVSTAAAPAAGASPAASASAGRAPFTSAAMRERAWQRMVWQQRLSHAQATLDTYRRSTRYPHDSRPLAEQPDQVHPAGPIVEDRPLRMPGSAAGAGMHLRTTQERVFVLGNESVLLGVSLRDDDGRALPLRVVRASVHEVPAPNTASLFPSVPLNVNDEGLDGDAVAGDGNFSVRLEPSAQGFDGLLGQLRVEVLLQSRGHQGFMYFDVMVTPEPPATWAGGMREVLEAGSLAFYLKADVREAGRYVVTARVDDATGKPFALLTFNDEVATGPQEFRLAVFGQLVRDAAPVFPLTVRDVEAFLLRPDVFPDRLLMPRLVGPVHLSASHPLASFAQGEWQSEERDRYLAELGRDVDDARAQLHRLGNGP